MRKITDKTKLKKCSTKYLTSDYQTVKAVKNKESPTKSHSKDFQGDMRAHYNVVS